MLGRIWKKILLALGRKVERQEAPPETEEHKLEVQRLSQMQARNTLQGIRALQSGSTDAVKPTSSGVFKRWQQEAESAKCSEAQRQGSQKEVAASNVVSLSAKAKNTQSLIQAVSRDTCNSDKQKSFQELLEIGCDHFSAE